MPWPRNDEKAVLIVEGTDYADWETVYVKHSLKDDPPYLYRFTCSEGMPLAKDYAKIRIKPGMACSVILGGELAMNGRVQLRQVFFDANRHHIEIQGASYSFDMSHAAATTDKMEFNNKSAESIMREMLGKIGMNLKIEGGSLDSTPIPRVNVPPGASIHEFFEQLVKPNSATSPSHSSGINFTSNPNGDFVINLGPVGGSDTIVEGQNMITGREIIYNPGMTPTHQASGQRPVIDNKDWGAAVTHNKFLQSTVGGLFSGTGNPAGWMISEAAAWSQKNLLGRTSAEVGFLATDLITVTAVVHGWLKPSGGLWHCGQSMRVKSPMLILQGSEELQLKTAEFTQDDKSGTRTTLEICNATALAASGAVTTPPPN